MTDEYGTLTISKSSVAAIINDLGGTTYLPDGVYRVRVERSWYDYEIGGRMAGVLTDEASVAVAREVGTTPYEPKAATFSPEKIYFGADNFVPDA